MNDEGMSEGMMTVEEVAKYFAVCRRTVWKWMDAGDLPYFLKDRVRRTPRSAVRAYAEKYLVTQRS